MENIVENNITTNEDLNAAKNVINTVVKARKILKMYPSSNPVYIKNLEDTFDRFRDFFLYRDELIFRFSQYDIYYDSESVYSNLQKQESLAFLFFRDGMRELTFKKSVTHDEIEDFLKITTQDFDSDVSEDDIVTLFWQRDFVNIKYIAEDIFLTDEDETTTIDSLKQISTDTADLKKAYNDSLGEEESSPVSVMPLTEDDYKQLADIYQKDNEEKLPKIFNMLFEIINDADRAVEYEDICYFYMKTIEFAIKNSQFTLVTEILIVLKKIIGDRDIDPEKRKTVIKILLFVSGKKIIGIIGNLLENDKRIEKDTFKDFVCSLDKNAISQFIRLLDELQNMHARRNIIDALTYLGPKDIQTLFKGLHHPRWYVVRNIIYILRRIGEAKAIEPVRKTMKHEDYRVRREAVKALGALGKDNVLGSIQEGLDDEVIKVRKASLTAIGNIRTGSAKKIIMDQISKSTFANKDFNEKKEYFAVLARWNDASVFDFCTRIITKKSFWQKSKHYEIKACAAYGLGLLGDKKGLPILNRFTASKNGVLQRYSVEAIRRIENRG